MTQLTLQPEFKNRIIVELLKQRKNFGGADEAFAKQYGLNASVFSQIKNGKDVTGLVRDSKLLEIARLLNVSSSVRNWNAAKTEVFMHISEEVQFCKDNGKAMILVDDPEIGKTFTAKYLSKQLQNCFYIDCSQAKTRQAFVREFARVIGVDETGKYRDVKANIKYYLGNVLQNPVVILDEAGDLEYPAFLEIKEFWNATDGRCGWYMMGADALAAKIKRGIANKKVGYREIFSRFSSKFSRVTPTDAKELRSFYETLTTGVLTANCTRRDLVPKMVKKCLTKNEAGNYGGLRRAESLLILTNSQA